MLSVLNNASGTPTLVRLERRCFSLAVPPLDSVLQEFGYGIEVQLLLYATPVGFYRFSAQVKTLGNFLNAVPLSEHLENSHLPIGKLIDGKAWAG